MFMFWTSFKSPNYEITLPFVALHFENLIGDTYLYKSDRTPRAIVVKPTAG